MSKRKQLSKVLLFLVVCSPISLQAEIDPYLQKREQLARDAVAQDPRSEDARVRLAKVLLDKKQFQEALREARNVLELNPGNEEAQATAKLAAILSSDMSREEQAEAMFKDFSDRSSEIVPPVNEAAIRRETELKREKLDRQYGISKYNFPRDPRPLQSSRRKLLSEYNRNSNYPEALKLSLEELQEYPGSDEAQVDHAKLLLAMGRIEEAQQFVEKGLMTFPEHPQLRILQEGIRQLLAAASTEARASIKMDLTFTLLTAQMLKADALIRKLKATPVK